MPKAHTRAHFNAHHTTVVTTGGLTASRTAFSIIEFSIKQHNLINAYCGYAFALMFSLRMKYSLSLSSVPLVLFSKARPFLPGRK